jgi:hypothetical protein
VGGSVVEPEQPSRPVKSDDLGAEPQRYGVIGEPPLLGEPQL